MFKKLKVAFLLSACLLLPGCGKTASLHVYEYSGANDDTAVLDYSGEVYEDGSLNSFMRINTGAFEAFGEVSVSANALETAVTDKLNAICAQGYQVESIESNAILCVNAQQQLFFVVSAKPMISSMGLNASTEENCIFIVTVE